MRVISVTVAIKSLPYHRTNLDEQLLQAAAEVVATKGVSALSLRELGRLTGVSRSAAYHYFSDKAALLARVGELGFQRLKARIAAEADGEADPVRRLRLGLAGYVAFAREDEHFFRLMFADVLDRPRADTVDGTGAVFDFSSEAALAAFTVLVQGVEAVIATGKGPKPDALLMTNTLWSFVHGLAVLALNRNLKFLDAGPVLDSGLDLLLAPWTAKRR